MNGFGYDPMCMFPNSPYCNYGTQNTQQQPVDPNMQEQQSIVEHLRTWVSGLSAVTGISYGFASLMRVFMKALKFLNIFKGKKTTNIILHNVWKASGSRGGIKSVIKYFLASIVVLAQVAVYFIIRKKREQLKFQIIKEEEIKRNLDEAWENQEISIDDFMITRSKSNIYCLTYLGSESTLIEDETEINNKEVSVKLSHISELNNCKLFTINEELEHSFEDDDELIKKEIKNPEMYMGHHI